MISITKAVREIITASTVLEEGLSRSIISYSALARDIKPHVEKKVLKKVTNGSIIMAVKRVADDMQKKTRPVDKILRFENITVRSHLVELTYLNSPTILNTYRQLLLLEAHRKSAFSSVSQGIKEITITATEDIQKEITDLFKTEVLISQLEDLSSITISLPKNIVHLPGSYYSILKKLAWQNINVIEVLSTYTELTIIFATRDIEKAFSVLKDN